MCFVLVSESTDSYVKLMAELDKMVTKMVFENYGVGDYYDYLTWNQLLTVSAFENIMNLRKLGATMALTTTRTSTLPPYFTKIIIFNGIDGCMFCLTKEWSNDRIKACIHRVLLAENLETRYSLGLFSHNNKTISVPEELVWSNDRIKACIHRVILSENSETRYSLGLVSYNSKTICVPEEFVDEQRPLLYKPLNLNDYAHTHMPSIVQRKEKIKNHMAIQTQAKIPVFYFSNLDLKPGTSSWFSACKDVCSALEKYGFVVELGSNTLSELHNTMFSSVRELFEFPTETKMKVTYDKPFRGYSSFPPFKSTMIDNATSTDVTQKLTNIFWPNGNDLHRLVRLKYTEPKKTGTNQGIPSHTDKHFTTIVHQNRVWSNDKIKARIYRVMLNENSETRYSFGLVSYNNKTIYVPEEFVDEQHPLQYKPLNFNDYAHAHMASIAQRKEKVFSLC
ncbi:putative 2-oxoglutarate-dependent dioxygenase aop1.2 [Quercus suber]|uniref:2-oxoglutarate-dependent dioxygenase aop1.2 n=1 Tax=Quercus suber TaxID=58331 RepID=A0AAW0M9J5_QUESU